jgi:hypothetical protein
MKDGGAALVALALAAASCGGGGGAATSSGCGMVQPCGGDIHGTWTATSLCADTKLFGFDPMDICPAATASAAGSSLSGTATFADDGTFQVDEQLTLKIALTVPPSCGITGAACADLAGSLAPPGDAQFTSAVCAGSGSGCACTLVGHPLTITRSGTATTSGTTLTSTEAGQAPSAAQYCVQGNQIHVITLDAATGKVAGDVIWTKT